METKKGIPVSPGVGIGEAAVIGQEDLRIQRRSIPRSQVEEEIARFERGVEQAVGEINEEISRLGGPLKITRQILESHRDMMADPVLRNEIAARIREQSSSAEQALSQVLRGY
ncbi:MAG: hypothetical protein HY721_26545 [Planctomycetes bacterium]|nr:hypothetical protein [Planctomycetota bacterium]